jgi:1,4-dihydroxy-2-naphthoate octaprenyltransferase
VFVFFGDVPVVGTAYLQMADPSPLAGADAHRAGVLYIAFLASLPVGLLAVAILVVNNLRDIPTDRAAGKHTTAVRLGEAATRRAYELLVLAALLWPLALAALLGNPLVLLALLAAPLALRTVRAMRLRTGSALNASLGETARLQLVFGLLLAGGFLVSALPL